MWVGINYQKPKMKYSMTVAVAVKLDSKSKKPNIYICLVRVQSKPSKHVNCQHTIRDAQASCSINIARIANAVQCRN